jgi:hypothetical protein
LEIQEYFNLVLSTLEKGDYNVIYFHDIDKKGNFLLFNDVQQPNIKSLYLESINYFMYEYMKDRKDNRLNFIFEYILVPKDTDPLFDFNKISFREFFDFLIKIKET